MRSSNKLMKQLINIISVAGTGIFLALPAVILHQLSAEANHEVNHVQANGTLISQDSDNNGGDNGDSDNGDDGPTGQQGDDSDNGDDNGDDGPTGQQGDSSDEGNDDSDTASDRPSDSGAATGGGDAFEGLRHGNDNRITIDNDDDDVNDGEINGF